MELTIYGLRPGTTLQPNGYGGYDEEASTLGLRPGEWPPAIECDAPGMGRVWLVRGQAQVVNEDIGAVAYVSRNGLVRLLVWND